MQETQQTTQIPFSMEAAAGVVAEHCYQDRQLHHELLDDPLAVVSRFISEKAKRPVDLKEKLPNCKVHVLKNDNKRWHIVLPFEYHDETPSLENGILTEDDLEQVAGGIFGLSLAAGGGVGAIATSVWLIQSAGALVAVPTLAAASAVGAGAGFTVAAAGSTFLSAGAIAGITAGIVGGGLALAGGVAVSAIAGLDAAGIIDAW